MMALDAEVLIVGGGPAGASAAFFLARAGVDVLVVDRARFPRDKPCGEYLSPQASRILSEMSLLEAVEAAGAAQLTGMRVRAPNGYVIHGEFASSHGFRGFRDCGLALRRLYLDHLLLDRARGAGARVSEGTVAQDVTRRGDGRIDGLVVRSPDGARELRARLVIGADGLHSIVGRRLGLTRVGRWPRRIAFVTHYTNVAGMGTCGEMHVDREGYVGLAAVGAGVTNVAVVVPTGGARAAGGDALGFVGRYLESRPHLAVRFREARRLTPVRATGPFNTRARRAWFPGALLSGDAADFFDPFTGEGIYAALRGGELLTPYAFEAARATSARSADVALAAYDRSRHHEFRDKWIVERAIGAVVALPALLDRAARVLSRRPEMADILVGVTGDFVPPREVLRPSFLLKLFVASTREQDVAPSPTPTEPRLTTSAT